MGITKIRKRDGRIVEFDITKIENAIAKAFIASGEVDARDVSAVSRAIGLLLRSGRKLKGGPAENPCPGFIPAIFGDIFRIADDSCISPWEGWVLFGSEDDIAAWKDAARSGAFRSIPRSAKFYMKNDALCLAADGKNILLNVN